MHDRFGATNPKALHCRFHTQTGGSTLTAQQPDNNVARVTLQALAAVLGGTQSLHTNGADEALALPTERSARTALRTQQIIAHESGVTDTVDPLAGSYYVEALTDEIESRARRLIERVDDAGGAAEAIEHGLYQQEIARSAYEYQMAVESGDRIVVGVNAFAEAEEPVPDLFLPDQKVVGRQVAELAELRRSRDPGPVEEALKELSEAASGTGNLMPTILTAVRARCTLGEIANAFRSVWGEYS